jgi:hypothetical protein
MGTRAITKAAAAAAISAAAAGKDSFLMEGNIHCFSLCVLSQVPTMFT